MATIISSGYVITPTPPRPYQVATVIWDGVCVTDVTLCIAQHDDRRFAFNVKDRAGNLLDVSGVAEIAFVIASRVGGTKLVTKLLTNQLIQIGVNSRFYLDISDIESGALTPGRLYFEAQITGSSGLKNTVAAGPFIVQDTIIGD